MRVGIIDKNTYYQSRVCEIMNEKYQGELEIFPLSVEDISGIETNSYDMLLVDDENISDENIDLPIVYLSDEKDDLVRDEKVFIFRYNNVQMMHDLIYESKEALINIKEEKQKAEEEARQKAEEEARQKAEEEARQKAEEEARQKEEEEARQKAEEEARQKAEEEARQKAEEEARQKAEEEARQKAEEEARQKAEEEARQKAEEEERQKAEEEARQKAEEEARQKAEEEARQKAEEEQEAVHKEVEETTKDTEKESVEIDLSTIHCKVVTFMSLGGGMGSSTMAAGTAVYYAKAGKKVLYVNLKPFSKSGYFSITGTNISISDIIKSVEKNDGNENTLFNNICVNKSGVYTMDSFVNYSDISKFNYDFIMKYVMMVDKIGNYDVLILDMNASKGKEFEGILKVSSSICMVMDGSEYSNQKACKAISFIESIDLHLSDKVKIICNKFTNSPEVDRSIENKAIGGVAYIQNDNPLDVIDRIGSMRFLNLIIK